MSSWDSLLLGGMREVRLVISNLGLHNGAVRVVAIGRCLWLAGPGGFEGVLCSLKTIRFGIIAVFSPVALLTKVPLSLDWNRKDAGLTGKLPRSSKSTGYTDYLLFRSRSAIWACFWSWFSLCIWGLTYLWLEVFFWVLYYYLLKFMIVLSSSIWVCIYVFSLCLSPYLKMGNSGSIY